MVYYLILLSVKFSCIISLKSHFKIIFKSTLVLHSFDFFVLNLHVVLVLLSFFVVRLDLSLSNDVITRNSGYTTDLFSKSNEQNQPIDRLTN